MALKKYEFGYYDETPYGTEFIVVDRAKCDSDAQAEHYVRNHIGSHEDRIGLKIRRVSASTEWFCNF